MNKQEAIKELESLKMKSKEIRSECYNSGINAGITILNKLDEPQKAVVPKFVAEWFEEHKSDLNYSIWKYIRDWEKQDETSDFYQWFDAFDKSIETLFRMKDGYEVEKEPLYRVKLGEGYFVEYQGRGALIIPDDNKEIKIFNSKSDAERTAQTIGGTVEEVAEG